MGTALPSNAQAFLAIGIVKKWPAASLGNLAPGCWLNTDIVLLLAGKTGNGNVRSTTGA